MTTWLIRHLVRNYTHTTDHKVRQAYGTLGTGTGVTINILLATLKFLLGVLTGSLAVTADAVNNLSDTAGSVMSLISVRLAAKPQDKEHPFGHGRMEYIGALAVGVLILVAGVKLLLSGAESILHPAALNASLLVMVLLGTSILVKLWMFFFYRYIARTIDNKTLAAASNDSISDVAATSTVLISLIVQTLLDWRIDGYIGVLVALFVLKTGVDVCKDTIDRLLGEKPNPQLALDIKSKLLSYEGISGVHDLVVHDYGPGRCIASVHAEVSATANIVAVHETVDKAERELQKDLGIVVCIHTDPTVTDDPTINDVQLKMETFLQGEDRRLSLHDFRMVPGQKQINLIFDCLLPDDYSGKENLRHRLAAYAKQLDPRYEIVVQFDTDFT